MLSACKPRSVLMATAPEGPPEYVQGWNDGCESGLATYGNAYYRTFYHFKQDRNLVDNDLYYRTWSDAYNYCRHFTKSELAYGSMWTFKGGYFSNTQDPHEDLRLRRDVFTEGFDLPNLEQDGGGYQLLGWGQDEWEAGEGW